MLKWTWYRLCYWPSILGSMGFAELFLGSFALFGLFTVIDTRMASLKESTWWRRFMMLDLVLFLAELKLYVVPLSDSVKPLFFRGLVPFVIALGCTGGNDVILNRRTKMLSKLLVDTLESIRR